MPAAHEAVVGRTLPREAVGRVVRDGADEGGADCDVQFLAWGEGRGGGERGDAVDEAGVVGGEVGEVEELGGLRGEGQVLVIDADGIGRGDLGRVVCTTLLTFDGGASISMAVYTIALVRGCDGDSGVEDRCTTVFGSGHPGFDTQIHELWCFYVIALR